MSKFKIESNVRLPKPLSTPPLQSLRFYRAIAPQKGGECRLRPPQWRQPNFEF